ncbi:unnamed protein product [Ambrosiozyma monospora]|uniref:Unnamed protein product n=1 Tax=Ambrosiozyma monospora TaxID=43982 RepID=A0ACB5UD62_AMBMO|nr:unnamed protein product [Ambrosiozyma monospora]
MKLCIDKDGRNRFIPTLRPTFDDPKLDGLTKSLAKLLDITKIEIEDVTTKLKKDPDEEDQIENDYAETDQGIDLDQILSMGSNWMDAL